MKKFLFLMFITLIMSTTVFAEEVDEGTKKTGPGYSEDGTKVKAFRGTRGDRFYNNNEGTNLVPGRLKKDENTVILKDNINIKDLLMSVEGQEEEGIAAFFIANFIKSDMTDVEKEIKIIEYLVSTTEYDIEAYNSNNIPQEDYTARGALVNHKAVCAGFAKAFEFLSKKCGLNVCTVSGTAINKTGNGPHAWNQICLDGEWYNVDVTWEKPVGTTKYGFGNLRNDYINCTDEDFKDHFPETSTNQCVATKYGYNFIALLMTGSLANTNVTNDEARRAIIKTYQESLSQRYGKKYVIEGENPLKKLGAKFDDGSNWFNVDDENKIDENKVIEYVKNEINNGKDVIFITYPLLGKHNGIQSASWYQSNIVKGVNFETQSYEDNGYNTVLIVHNVRKYTG